MSQVAGPSTLVSVPTVGSRTIVLQDAQQREEEQTTIGVLQLRATSRSPVTTGRTPPRVTWTEDVVDNEGMGKKKSKICCIFHKQRRYDESSSSSSDSDSSDSGSDDSGSDGGGGARPGGRLRDQRRHNGHSHPHPHPQRNGVDGGQATRDSGGGSTIVHELSSDDEYEPNAYERQPGKKRKKEKGKMMDKDGGGGGGDPIGGEGQPQSRS